MLHRERIAFDFEDIIKHTVSVRSNLQRSWAYRYNTAHIWATDRKTLSLQIQHSTYLGHGPQDLEPTDTTRHIVGPRTARPWAYRYNTAHIWATDRKTLSLQVQHSTYLGHGPQDLEPIDTTQHIFGPRTERPWAYRYNTAHSWATDSKTLSLQTQHGTYLGHGPQDLEPTDTTQPIFGPRTARPWAYRYNTAHIWATDRKTWSRPMLKEEEKQRRLYEGRQSVKEMEIIMVSVGFVDLLSGSSSSTGCFVFFLYYTNKCTIIAIRVYTEVIRKVSTVCAYLSRILETVTLRMCSDFLYQLRSHRRHFMKFVLCLCLFLCVKHF